MFNILDCIFNIYPLLDEADLPIPFKVKKRVRFSHYSHRLTIPRSEEEDKTKLWWKREDTILAKKLVDRHFAIFIETVNDDRLNKMLKPIKRSEAFRNFCTL
jgi:hypothetical protein